MNLYIEFLEKYMEDQTELNEIFDSDDRVCRGCGCTQFNACSGGCYWVTDDLCSQCVEKKID